MNIGQKSCKKCLIVKNFSEFYASKVSKDKLQYHCKICLRDNIAARRKANPQRAKEISRAHYLKYQDEIKRKNDIYRKSNPEKTAVWSAQWKKNNPDKARESGRKGCAKWRKLHPETAKACRLASHASRRGTLDIRGSELKPLLPKILSSQKGKCGCCRKKLDKYHLDHIKPVSKGGDNSPRNLQLLCAPCNIAKSNHDQIDFMRSRGFLL